MLTKEKYQEKLEKYQSRLEKAQTEKEKYYRKVIDLEVRIRQLEKKVAKYKVYVGFINREGNNVHDNM